VTIFPGPETTWTRNFNPFNGEAASRGDLGFVYEPLIRFDLAKGGKAIPWLASSYKWSNGNRTLTFTLRKGVKWNDGQPFTSADVVFDALLGKHNVAADTPGEWAYLSSVSAKGSYTVVFKFKQVNTTMLYFIGENLRIVPKHVWSKVGDPVKYIDANPVGTGPFKLGSFSPQVYTYVRNTLYWQKGKPYVSALRYPIYTSNDSAQLAAIHGDIDWAGIFIPDAAHTYASKSSYNHFWYYPADHPVSLYLNNTEAPFNNVHVRRAISLALDRESIYRTAEYGYEPPSNAAFIQPQFAKRWGNAKAMKAVGTRPNLSAAKAEMARAGHVDLTKTFKIEVPNGWTDWDATVSIIVSDLKGIGINAQPYLVSFPDPYLHDLEFGTFDMGLSWTDAGPSPYNIYHDEFWSQNSKPVGQQAGPNWERYSNATMDHLIVAYSKTSKLSQQVNIMKQMEALAASDVPIVPVVTGALWYEYNTKRFVGWPSSKNPYDLGPPFNFDSNLDVVLHLHQR
jgi:peptide/nickel transport system substrate-binding protein